MNTTYIYLIENCYGDPNKVYIGKTKNPKSRKIDHKRKYGEKIEYTIIDQIESLSKKSWEPLETYWIQQFTCWGFNILNIKKIGGSGSEYLTNETRDKISKALKGRKVTWVCNKLKGYKYTGDQKQNLIKGKQKCFEQYDLQGNFIKEWISTQSDIARFFNKDVGSLSAHLACKQKTALGYIWKIKLK